MSREYPPKTYIGGIATYTYTIAHALARSGHNVHVVTAVDNPTQVRCDGSVTVHFVRDVDYRLRALGYLLHSLAVARKIEDIGVSFDIVQAAEWSGEAFFYALRQKAPLITRLATPSCLVSKLNSAGGGFRSLFLDFIERVQTSKSAGIISSTTALAKVVSRQWNIPVGRMKVIPNSLEIERIKSLGAAAIPADLVRGDYLLFYGRLEERKGVHILAEAIRTVLARYAGLKMVFVGADVSYQGGSMREHIRHRCASVAERIVFIGNLPQSELFPIVARAKLVVLPSLWEAFGFVCLEAMILGRAVIASGGSGFEEIIEDGVSGFLVRPGDPRDLEAKIIWCLENDQYVKRVQAGAVRRAEHFAVSNIVSSLVQYYENVIKRFTSARA